MARLLFVTSRLPYPPREGHQLRSWHLLRAAARKHRVDLLCLQRPEDGEPHRVLADTVQSVTCVPLPSLHDPLNALHAGWHWLAHREPPIYARYVTAVLRREFRRKLRTLAGNWQLIAAQPWLMSPRANPAFFAWISHKVLRLLAPWALIVAFVASGFGETMPVRLAFWAQVLAYGVAVVTLLAPRVMRRVPLAATAGSFVTLNAAAFLSLPVYLGSRDLTRLWKA